MWEFRLFSRTLFSCPVVGCSDSAAPSSRKGARDADLHEEAREDLYFVCADGSKGIKLRGNEVRQALEVKQLITRKARMCEKYKKSAPCLGTASEAAFRSFIATECGFRDFAEVPQLRVAKRVRKRALRSVVVEEASLQVSRIAPPQTAETWHTISIEGGSARAVYNVLGLWLQLDPAADWTLPQLHDRLCELGHDEVVVGGYPVFLKSFCSEAAVERNLGDRFVAAESASTAGSSAPCEPHQVLETGIVLDP